MSLVKCKVCEVTMAVYFHVPDKTNYTCDHCINEARNDALHVEGEKDGN